jgi:hypothetical protein
VKDANGQALAYLYFEDEPQRQMSMKRLSRDEAFLIAVKAGRFAPSRLPGRLPGSIPLTSSSISSTLEA